ncbi:hypothetical protein L0B53_02385 [Vibrio sp. SS-MA-C1-2]|uniref:hypothetical protein n=1 Tax=Vibrio sp. SS-MA-C1-2 TaxID=2908646 RepID=UPI001F28EFFF|nr:hypothetical protein [Vibrio sp. SS-MA-C1-2]UJF16815.1 hypothetical protein L0B53_02385 [Vibrio sp. SS-MA-C1-2]
MFSRVFLLLISLTLLPLFGYGEVSHSIGNQYFSLPDSLLQNSTDQLIEHTPLESNNPVSTNEIHYSEHGIINSHRLNQTIKVVFELSNEPLFLDLWQSKNRDIILAFRLKISNRFRQLSCYFNFIANHRILGWKESNAIYAYLDATSYL